MFYLAGARCISRTFRCLQRRVSTLVHNLPPKNILLMWNQAETTLDHCRTVFPVTVHIDLILVLARSLAFSEKYPQLLSQIDCWKEKRSCSVVKVWCFGGEINIHPDYKVYYLVYRCIKSKNLKGPHSTPPRSITLLPMLSDSMVSVSPRLYVIEHVDPSEPSEGVHDQREVGEVASPSCYWIENTYVVGLVL